MEVLEHFVEGGEGVGLAYTVMDVGYEGSGGINPIVAVWDAFDIVAETVGEVFDDSLEGMVVGGSDVR